jgi:glycosyltransferase involved in cell wall biosynthesis
VRQLAFYRDFRCFSGGHLKVWDYFCHSKCAEGVEPTIYFTDRSQMDDLNPWVAAGERIAPEWEPKRADALFLGGMDWLAVPEDCTTPVINLVQGVCHSEPSNARYGFLSRRAVRICVSQPVTDAILATGRVNGPVVTIPAGLDYRSFPAPAAQRDIAVLIVGLKQPALARELAARLTKEAIANTCLTRLLPRQEFLRLLGRARVTVFLPHPQEGFYLPALEGMAAGTLVVCPDCVGNRHFCVDGKNCYLPPYNEAALLEALCRATNATMSERNAMIVEGARQLDRYALVEERRRYLEVLDAVVAAETPS